jgi:Zn ribbon nucleic-acid-binding protein
MSIYLYLLQCPRCEREAMIDTQSKDPLPVVFCGECGKGAIAVEMKIVSVTVGQNS